MATMSFPLIVRLMLGSLPLVLMTDAQETDLRPYDNLTSILLKSYNSHNPPSHNETTGVEMGLILHSITKLDEFEGTFSAVAWQRLLWKDPRLSWNASDFDSIKVIRIPAEQIWIPDIILYNSVAKWQPMAEVHALAYEDGTIYYIVPINIKSSCKLKLEKYPYDTQNCTLIWGSWMHDDSKISLRSADVELDLQDFIPNPTWEIIRSSMAENIKTYGSSDESYQDITISILLQRRQPESLIASAVITTWMILIVFVIAPPSSGERIVFSGFIFLAFIFLSAWLSITVPSYTSTNLGRYLVFGLLMTAMITVLMAVCYGLYPRQGVDREKDGPATAREILNERRRRYFRLFDLGAMVVTVALISIMTGSLFAP